MKSNGDHLRTFQIRIKALMTSSEIRSKLLGIQLLKKLLMWMARLEFNTWIQQMTMTKLLPGRWMVQEITKRELRRLCKWKQHQIQTIAISAQLPKQHSFETTSLTLQRMNSHDLVPTYLLSHIFFTITFKLLVPNKFENCSAFPIFIHQ